MFLAICCCTFHDSFHIVNSRVVGYKVLSIYSSSDLLLSLKNNWVPFILFQQSLPMILVPLCARSHCALTSLMVVGTQLLLILQVWMTMVLIPTLILLKVNASSSVKFMQQIFVAAKVFEKD